MITLIPLAGLASRFKEIYDRPKPLIQLPEFDNKPMIQVVIENLNCPGQHVFIIRKEHDEEYLLSSILHNIIPDCSIIVLDHVTDGAVRTALMAKEFINTSEPLFIANSDQYVPNFNIQDYLWNTHHKGADGGIAVFKLEGKDNKWSFVELDNNGNISKVVEKIQISQWPTVGFYSFARGSDFVAAAERMIDKNIRTNNEFYLAPSYNEMILDKKIIKPYIVDSMIGLGTPSDLQNFQQKVANGIFKI